MDYQIALSPELGLNPDDFVAAWNDEAECRAVAEARLDEPDSAQYDPLLTGAMAVLGSVAVGLATNALYDLIKGVLTKRGISRRTEILQMEQPDGTCLLVIRIVEE
jgi:hypothetical protein